MNKKPKEIISRLIFFYTETHLQVIITSIAVVHWRNPFYLIELSLRVFVQFKSNSRAGNLRAKKAYGSP